MTGVGITTKTVVEYSVGTSVSLTELGDATQVSRGDLLVLLERASARLTRELALPEAAFQVVGDRVLAQGVAGLVELAPRIALEVVPKFLDASDPDWREDFFVFAVLSRYGRILDRDVVSGGYGAPKDLATLIGRTALRLHGPNERLPLRIYRTRRWRGFDASGELDEEDLLVPDPDGFAQSSVVLERNNIYTSVIGDAMRTLASEVAEPITRRRLDRIGQSYPPATRRTSRPPRRVPSRHARWQPLYDLALTISAGRRVDYAGDSLATLGYAIKTSDGWQDFLSLALETSLGAGAVHRGRSYVLGMRSAKEVETTPDLTLDLPAGPLLVDAKYKGRASRQLDAVSAADLYEAFAFARSAKLKKIVLVFPRGSALARTAVGTVEQFDAVEIEGLQVVGVHVECRGLAARGAFPIFARGLADSLSSIGR